MGSIAEKLIYMSDAIDDIQLAINEMGVETDDTVELEYYGDKIRSIKTGAGSNDKNCDCFTQKDFNDVSDLVITGNIEEVNTFDCITLDALMAYDIENIILKTIEDVSNLYQ